MRIGRETREAVLNVDMTPLIDVAFLLLIFFMIISVFNRMERQAELELPEAYQALIHKDIAKDRMVINVERDGRIKLFGQPATIDELRREMRRRAPMLRRYGLTAGRAPVEVRGDKKCQYRHIRGILAALYEERIDKVFFSAYPRQQKQP